MNKCNMWRLKEAEIKEAFHAKVEERVAMRVDGNVDETWGGLRDCLLEVADEVNAEELKKTSDIARLGGGILRLARSLRRRDD